MQAYAASCRGLAKMKEPCRPEVKKPVQVGTLKE